MKRLTPLVLALVLVLFLSTVGQAQPCPNCPNGRCGTPQASAPLFLPVSYAAPMPQACPCTTCTCAAGTCPGGCPTTTAAPPAALSDSRPLFPRVRAFVEGRPRLFRRGLGY